ncbi:uncharacterized protein LOC127868570 [Dreissena polymorpha]|uniref:DUF6589 domain-containing protein n=1 Tax=Dreissena polymorpha TaxID=45954 RepID=A0A9D4M6F4_DREPO|nr:uncharacterized protein LOC127868570 [Dreissena polymorpha]KAH3871762.1 hypothetical protein DPMN_034976 [Dreissena polymorpha]
MVKEQLMEFFGMESPDSSCTQNVIQLVKSKSENYESLLNSLRQFLDHFGYLDYVHETDDVVSNDTDDTVYNYCCNLCHWYMHLMMFEDIVKEGDVARIIPCLMVCAQFFFSNSRLSKYFQECLDFVLKCEYCMSPMQRIRTLEGAFVNLRGGAAGNIESDLVQENSVRNQKDLIRALGANKSEKAIQRSCRAADTVSDIFEKIEISTSVRKVSSRHQTPARIKDNEVIANSLRDLRPFSKTIGRVCQGMPNVLCSPVRKINSVDLKFRIKQVVDRLYYGHTINFDHESSEEDC